MGILPSGGSEIEASVQRRDPGATEYRISLDRRGPGGPDMAVNVLVNDNDGKGRKQFSQWMPGLGETKDPSGWHPVMLRDTADAGSDG